MYQSFIFGLALFNVLNTNFIQSMEHMAINYVDDTKLRWITNARSGAELGSKRRQMSGPNLTKKINVGLRIWVQKIT